MQWYRGTGIVISAWYQVAPVWIQDVQLLNQLPNQPTVPIYANGATANGWMITDDAGGASFDTQVSSYVSISLQIISIIHGARYGMASSYYAFLLQ